MSKVEKFVTVILIFLGAGAGFLRTRKPFFAPLILIFWAVYVLLADFFATTLPRLLTVSIPFYIIILLIFCYGATLIMRQKKPPDRNWWNRWYSVLGFLVIVALTHQVVSSLRNLKSYGTSRPLPPSLQANDLFMVDTSFYSDNQVKPSKGDIISVYDSERHETFVYEYIEFSENDGYKFRNSQGFLNLSSDRVRITGKAIYIYWPLSRANNL